jgi:hypothetical protein
MSFWDWFIGDAGAAWIIGILTVAGALFAYFRRERPPVILIQEIEQQSMLSIHEARKEKLQALYKDQDGQEYIVENLQQKDVAIYNMGSKDVLEPITFTLLVSDETDKKRSLFEIIFDDNNCKYEKQTADKHSDKLKAQITIPYLNSFQQHGHSQKAYFLSDTDTNITLEHGMGKGWSSRYVSLDDCKLALSKYDWFVKAVQVSIAAILLVMVFIANIYTSPQVVPITIHMKQDGQGEISGIEITPVQEPQLQIETPIGTFTIKSSILWVYLLNNQIFSILFICFTILILVMTVAVYFRNALVYKIYLKCIPPSSLAQHKNA